MPSAELERELLKKSQQIRELQQELEHTNQGILLMTMELEQAQEESLRERAETIQQLQQELEFTNQGLLALMLELDQAKEKYRNILEYASEAIFTFDDQAYIETYKPAALRLFGYQGEALQGLSLKRLIPGFGQLLQGIRHGELADMMPKTLFQNDSLILGCKEDGLLFPVEITFGAPFYNSNDEKTWMVIIRDITERKKTEQGLRLMARIFEESHDAIMITDTDANIIDVNSSFTAITGYSKDEVLGQNPRLMQSDRQDPEFYQTMWRTLCESGKWSGEIWDKRKNGEIYPKWLSVSAVKEKGGNVSHYVGIFSDITERKANETRLKHLAHYDQLTNLPNRTLFLEQLQWAIDLANREREQVALLFLDLDRFKVVNDTLGHQVGDLLLVEVAQRLRDNVRKSDIVSRLAGDEFTVVLNGINEIEEAALVAGKILQAFNRPVQLEGREFYVTTSIGITIYPNDAQETDELLKNADSAMYYAKERGKNNYQFFSNFMNQKVREELELDTNLRKALLGDEFVLYYQPQVDVASGQVVGLETLVRWQHPELGLLSPDKFIPFAERTDLIVLIGQWVMRHACEQFVRWRQLDVPPLKIAINYSGVQLKQPNQVATIAQLVAETGMDPRYLALELTESVAMEDAEHTVKTLHELKKMGISIAIDDFGTGYSSLSYLKRFPIDTLKIDKSFVDDITDNSDDEAIATTIIAMAHNLRLAVVAEGVETEEQLQILREKHCDQAQGYYLCRPVPADQVLDFIRNNRGFANQESLQERMQA